MNRTCEMGSGLHALSRRGARLATAGLLAAAAVVSQVHAEAGPAADDAGPAGRALLQLRPRFTYIDQSNKPLAAEAFNMRVLLGYRSAPVGDFQLTGQVVAVIWLGSMRANNRPGNQASPYPLVGDPDKADLNLLHVDYGGWADTRIRVGRQAIRLDNERFVGDADVRQMPQVFDAVSMRNTGFADTELYAAYAWQVRTYYGESFRMATTLLNARRDFEAGMSVGAYAYFNNQPVIHQATQLRDHGNSIAGVRVEGRLRTGEDLSWYYTAEVARQRAFAGGDPAIRAGYHRLALGPTWRAVSAQVSDERLGSNDGRYGFQTPLTFNTFQGWAYEFFSTPRQGIRDRSIAASVALGRLNLWLKRHHFDADFGPLEFGRERDFAFSYRVDEALSVRGVFAHFRSNAAFFRPSAERYYLTLQYDY